MSQAFKILLLSLLMLALTACNDEKKTAAQVKAERDNAVKTVHQVYAKTLPGCAVTLGIENYWRDRLQQPGGQEALQKSASDVAASKPACMTGAKTELASKTNREPSSTTTTTTTRELYVVEQAPCPDRQVGISNEGYICRRPEDVNTNSNSVATASNTASDVFTGGEPTTVGGVQ